MIFDLDRFKSINDQYGHAVGHAVSRKFCEVTSATLRPHGLFGRIGGEVFVVGMPVCGVGAAFARAERIRRGSLDSCRFVGAIR